MRLLLSAALYILLSWPAGAAAANLWGIDGEKALQFEATVVDLLCTLSGNCPPQCGGGRRQLGLLRDDGTLVPAAKSNTLFAGAVLDLLPYCGGKVEVDGLLIQREETRFYMVQRLRPPGGAWQEADAYGETWARENREKTPKEWFRKDPRVRAVIEKYGIIGIPGSAAKKE